MPLPEKLNPKVEGTVIRLYQPEDFDHAYQIIREIGTDILGRGLRSWDEIFSAQEGTLWTAIRDYTPIGFACSSDLGNGVAVFHTDIVSPLYQRSGIGTCLTLVRLATLDPDEINLIGLTTTQHSQDFYKRFGFLPEDPQTHDPASRMELGSSTLEFNEDLSDQAWDLLQKAGVKVFLEETS